jgi:hapalindole-type alkaloid chlorinase
MSTAAAQRRIRSAEVNAADLSGAQDAIAQMYEDQLDVLIVRRALDAAPLSAAGERLDRDDADPGWARPNVRMPVEDIQILGTDTPATPTYTAPTGASLEAYLDSAEKHRQEGQGVFGADFDAASSITRLLERFSSGKPVEIARADDGRQYVPFTVRRLVDGKQIGLHHDYHYPLALYRQLAPKLDTRTLVSYVAVMRKPDAGGELCVYAVTPDTPNPPKLANGFQWDLDAVEKGYDSQTFTLEAGDFFLLASGRCLHRIAPIKGPRARVTMGGFLALSKDRDRVYFWS